MIWLDDFYSVGCGRKRLEYGRLYLVVLGNGGLLGGFGNAHVSAGFVVGGCVRRICISHLFKYVVGVRCFLNAAFRIALGLFVGCVESA